MHLITHVGVRRDGITLAVLPVGSVHGGDFVLAAELEALESLLLGDWATVRGEVPLRLEAPQRSRLTVAVANPTDRTLRWTLSPPAADGWSFAGELEGELAAGARRELSLEVGAPPLPSALSPARPGPALELTLHYPLASGPLQPVRVRREVPLALPDLDEAARSARRADNRVLVLDGESALRVDLGGSPSELTLECWVRGEAPARRAGLVNNTEGSGFGLFWQDSSRAPGLPNGMVHLARRPDGRRGYVAAGAREPWEWGRWTHVALTYDGRAVRYFVDGRLVGESEGSGAVTPNGLPLYVGADTDGRGRAVSFFRGALDEVRLSRVARYRGDFRPARTFERDADTLLLLHLDREVGGLHPDDSGARRHAWAVGTPTLAPERR